MSNEKFQRGLALRKQVLGAEYVEKSMAAADAFSMPMQELSTEYCWGHVWTRPGLALRDRSLINIAMISALNRPHELKLHVKAALNNGLSREEIREVILQVAVYCGVPAGKPVSTKLSAPRLSAIVTQSDPTSRCTRKTHASSESHASSIELLERACAEG